MKNLFLNIVYLLISCQLIMAQGENRAHSIDNGTISSLNENDGAAYIASNLSKKNTYSVLDYQKIDYNVQIQQIGESNTVKSLLRSNSVDLFVSQKGENNQLFLDKRADAISQRVSQEGKNNHIEDFALHSKYDVNMEFTQYGEDQSIKNYGVNSISKNMRVIQSGNGASVIILNKTKP